MKRILAGWLLLLGLSGSALAQSYNVALIPDSLKKDARAVVREEEVILEIKSPEKAIEKWHKAVSILNENGDDFSQFFDGYDKFESINWIDGYLYDANGKEIKHVKKKDMEDRSYVAEENLTDDLRYRAHNFYCRVYPYTVEYAQENETNGILAFRKWSPLPNTGVSTQHTKYVIIAPAEYIVRYKPVNCNFQPVVTTSGDKKIYTWEISNLAARSTEFDGPDWEEITPHVLFAPSDFEAEGYKGNMSTWENYGKFINQLRAGRDVLPDNVKQKVHELTDHLTDKRQKVFALYDYLQKNTRYISIQLGIGGGNLFRQTM